MNPLTEIFYLDTDSKAHNPIGSNIFFNLPKGARSLCQECRTPITWNANWDNVELEIIGDTTHYYPDYISGNYSIISQRLLDDLVNAEASGFKAHAVGIIGVESKKLRSQQAPKYFIMEIFGGIDLDREKWDKFDGNLCSICKTWRPRKGGTVSWGDKQKVPLMNSWDGSDFMKFKNVKIGGDLCSRKILKLAQVKKWSGFGVRAILPG
ncbi:MAG: hypothetical protein JWM59_2278 [Verrucomicrobiales bacterium]|nr:hypothetical protein [Verrucomicrobiales bacterium]